jgi:hypothetical protein
MLNEKTLQRIENIETICAAIDSMAEVMNPLAKYLLPIKKELDLASASHEGRKISLNKDKWEEQYKKGVDRCVGFDISWI